MVAKSTHSIIANNISFEARTGIPILKNISLSLSNKKVGLIGKNGVGKTTLLRLIAGELEPTEGKISRTGKIAYLPQDYLFDLNQTVGSRKLASFSGGERMNILLTQLLKNQANFLLLDEPTNNLDIEAKELVYQTVQSWQGGCLVISHDRKLLNLMEEIWELTPRELKLYGGNYGFYKSQKELEDQALHNDLVAAQIDFKKTKNQAQKTKEKQEKRSSRDKKSRKTSGQPKIVLNTMRDWGEKTTSRLKKLHIERIENAAVKLIEAKDKISPKNKINVDLSLTTVPSGKLVVEMKDITFSYGENKKLFNNFNLNIYGPERITISGPNGSGKTTLVRLMLGELSPENGRVRLGVKRVAYLDQHTSILELEKTLVENVKKVSNLEEGESRKWLGKFLFSDDAAFKKTRVLSGGERMRAVLACILAGENSPQLLILDEPTNNLDLDSIERIESALSNFRGALIVISHDQEFLNNLDIDKEVKL